MIGNWGGGVRPSISSSSVWQTPQAATRIRISPSPGSGTASSICASGLVPAETPVMPVSTIAFINSTVREILAMHYAIFGYYLKIKKYCRDVP
jgi:hypothetical protein